MIVTIANAKGGVAKTTSAIYLAAAYARRFEEGATVLDADPQSSASLWRDMAEENGGWPAGTCVQAAGHQGRHGALPRQAPRVPPGARRDRRSDGGARMRNLDMAFRPAARTRSVSGMADVFRSDQTGEWSKTSVSMRPETRRRLKTYAAAHDMRIQEVIDLALEAYLA